MKALEFITNDTALRMGGEGKERERELCVIFSLNDVEKGDIKQDLVSVIPGIESSIPRIVVKHGYMKILIMERNVCVFVSGGFGGVRVVDLGSCQVRVSNVQGATDHEGLSSTSLWVACAPALQHLQRVLVQLADDNVACVLVGGIHSPQPNLICHQVNIGKATPGVRVDIVKAGILKATLCKHPPSVKAVFNDDVALIFVEIEGAVVDNVVGSCPFEWKVVCP